ncbi:BZ3500_MvSof-1268-A1-R1_Chr4-3g07316 [Microbotryum saponariae]|uniref:BZ3500_MvSof-1268-A1-R1_Chr4-3g07316 protein n=1 Tax=Microbotryum saponariae TaxID=289078 RepID=A0A2X0LLY2_9BASI|nr:BZ3500_MvSof-1268-A1-R1_Chr4-3g07316 [Microbotryum saponariae]SDA06979.1 BZ3501_MvSof-1269-A2-R1_Chr4-2g07025 [Microbotryum saponariae]
MAQLNKCAACGKTAPEAPSTTGSDSSRSLQVCSKCRGVAYCSRECQVGSRVNHQVMARTGISRTPRTLFQIKHWPSHKSQCPILALSNKMSSTTVSPKPQVKSTTPVINPIADPWSSFKPFLDSISTELCWVLSLPYVPHVHDPIPSTRQVAWYHLHFSLNPSREVHTDPKAGTPTSQNSRRQFVLKLGQRTSLPTFLDWIRSEPSHTDQPQIVEQYHKQLSSLVEADRTVFEKDGKLENQSLRRVICTAEDVNRRFVGLSIQALGSHTVTRSALDPLNEDLDWVGPLSRILETIEPGDVSEESASGNGATKSSPGEKGSTKLLEKVVRELMKDEGWAERSLKSWKEGDKKENHFLHAALLKRGIKEQVLVGGRLGKGYYYAVPVSVPNQMLMRTISST